MNAVEFNKFPPRLYKKGRYRTADWFYVGQIGTEVGGRVLTRSEYLTTESLYISAIHIYMAEAGISGLLAHSLEYWDLPQQRELLQRCEIDDVLDGSEAPHEGELLSGARLENAFRRCLREDAWLEFIQPRRFLVHVAHDYRVIIASDMPLEQASEQVRRQGLYTYPARTSIVTLQEWRSPVG